MFEWIQAADDAILLFLQQNRTPFLDAVMPIITYLGSGGILWIVIAAALGFTKKYRRYGLSMIVSLCLGLLIGNGILKHLVMRIRPCDAAPDLEYAHRKARRPLFLSIGTRAFLL